MYMYKLSDLISWFVVISQKNQNILTLILPLSLSNTNTKLCYNGVGPLNRLLTKCPQSTQETGDSTLTVFTNTTVTGALELWNVAQVAVKAISIWDDDHLWFL